MADMSAKLSAITQLVEEGAYFTINRPRQYGKTSIIHHLFLALNKRSDYLAISLSFEGIGDVVFDDEAVFCQNFIDDMAHQLRKSNLEYSKFLQKTITTTSSLKQLSRVISDFVDYCEKKVVIMIDEIDKSSNHQLFLSFLGILRDKYLNAHKALDSTFHSVILAGVHDIKSLKSKIKSKSTGKLNSPWNIAIDFKVEMSFNTKEIEYMLEDYVQDREVKMNTSIIAEKIYHYTSGYPYLVSKLCKFIDEDILPQKTESTWELEDLDHAFRLITYGGYTTTLFDTLTKNLENDPQLYEMIFDMSINGSSYDFNINAPLVDKAVTHGIIRDKNGLCHIHNRIFEQRLYGYFLAKQQTEGRAIRGIFKDNFYVNGELNILVILQRFQQFMKENYSKKDSKFLEREGRLLFLSFLKPIINGKGFDFKEPNVAAERRMDIVITYGSHRYVIELKRWEGEIYHQKGLQQLSDYLDTYNLKKGFLLIFDFRKNKSYKEEQIKFQDKDILAVWV